MQTWHVQDGETGNEGEFFGEVRKLAILQVQHCQFGQTAHFCGQHVDDIVVHVQNL